MLNRWRLSGYVCLAAGLIAPTLLRAQGFTALGGAVKAKEAMLKRLLPASVNLNQKRIKVLAVGISQKIPKDLLDVLTTKLVTAIQKDPRFILDDRNPETLLKFTVTNYYVEARTVPATQYSAAYTYYTGKIEASYQASEIGTDAPLDSENLVHAVTEEGVRTGSSTFNVFKGHSGQPDPRLKRSENEARDELVDGIVNLMSQRAAPFEEILQVPLPRGKLEPLSSLAMSARWAKLLEDSEKTDPLPKGDDDTYRKYLIGLANEALAYQDAREGAELEKNRRGDTNSDKAKESMAQEQKDFSESQSYLDKAAKAYKEAMEGKPSEKEFRPADARMEDAVRLYATISRHKAEYEAAVEKKRTERSGTTSAASETRGASGGASPAAALSGSTFNRVIGMCQDHQPDIAELIKDHPSELHFDKGLTLDEELKLRKECGPADSKAILDQIKAQVSANSAAKPASPPPPKKL